jgi:hypothetical protein
MPALVSHGIDVRAVVHDPGKNGIPLARGAGETVIADLGDRPACAPRSTASTPHSWSPLPSPDAAKIGVGLVEAAQAAGVRKVVYNVYHPSLPLENHASTRPVEAALYASALDFTILQPAMYMQGLQGAFEQARRTGTLVMPCSKHSEMTYVDYRDVAEVAARAFRAVERSSAPAETAMRPCDSDYSAPSMARSQLRWALALRALAP